MPHITPGAGLGRNLDPLAAVKSLLLQILGKAKASPWQCSGSPKNQKCCGTWSFPWLFPSPSGTATLRAVPRAGGEDGGPGEWLVGCREGFAGQEAQLQRPVELISAAAERSVAGRRQLLSWSCLQPVFCALLPPPHHSQPGGAGRRLPAWTCPTGTRRQRLSFQILERTSRHRPSQRCEQPWS